MKANLKVILSVVGVAALLASPAMAKQKRHEKLSAVPSNARASVTPYAVNEGGPYTPSVAMPLHGYAPDFQLGAGR